MCVDLGDDGIVVGTRGERGAIVATKRGNDTADVVSGLAGSPDAPAVSTIGAGDVFHRARLAALVERRPLRDGLSFANTASALRCAALDGRTATRTRPVGTHC